MSFKKKSSPIHIMHVLGSFGPGGAEMGVVRLIRKLSDAKYRHSVCSIGPDISMQELLGRDIRCHSLNLVGPSYSAFFSLARLFKRENVHIAHVNNLAPWGDVFLGSVLAGCRCLQTFHGVEQGKPCFSAVKKQLFRILAKRSSAVTAVSDAAASLLHDLTGIARDQIYLINNGIDTDIFKPDGSITNRKKTRQKLGLPLDAIVFVCVAALRPVKNHKGLLNAFSHFFCDRSGPEKHLVLIGSGPEESSLKTEAHRLNIMDRVHFLGRRNDVPGLMNAMDVFVLNSKTEGLSYAVLEAMACGLPVVATAVGANPELVQEGQQGFLYNTNDNHRLCRLLEKIALDAEGRKIMGRNARKKTVSEFGITPMIDAYAALYHAIKP